MGALTRAVSKQLLPVYDKPMIYYPVSTLLHVGIREILIISTPHDLPCIKTLLGHGCSVGANFHYAVQPEPQGIAQAFLIGKDFINDEPVCLILGDNLFIGCDRQIASQVSLKSGAVIFLHEVSSDKIKNYGVAEIDINDNVVSIEEKPAQPKSNLAVTGIYMYDETVVHVVRELKPSARGELEITDLNRAYLKDHKLKAIRLNQDADWRDMGTPDALLDASNFVRRVGQYHGSLS